MAERIDPSPRAARYSGSGAAGLAHEPHRRARDRLAQAGGDQVGAGVRLEGHVIGSMTTAVP